MLGNMCITNPIANEILLNRFSGNIISEHSPKGNNVMLKAVVDH